MTTFDALGLGPELVDALAAEGIETPTALQTEVIPVLRKGHAALVRGASGAGLQVAWAAPLLERLEPSPGGPVLLVLAPSEALALEGARQLSRLAGLVGFRTASLGGPFALPGHADILFATPWALQQAVEATDVALEGVQGVVITGGAAILAQEGDPRRVEELLARFESAEVQRILVAEPVTPAVRSFAESHLKKAVFLPSDAANLDDAAGDAPISRGEVRARVMEQDEEDELPRLVGELLEGGAQHLLLFFRTEDRAADLGDLLTLHGFVAGAPGDRESPVWLATGGLEAREALEEAAAEAETTAASLWSQVLPVSVDVPSDADELDRRMGEGMGPGVVLVRAREMAHLRRIAAVAGYRISPFPRPGEKTASSEPFLAGLAEVVGGEDLDPYHLLLEPAIREYGATEVAAALAFLLRQRATSAARAAEGAPRRESSEAPGGRVAGLADRGSAPPAFVRLFLSVGTKDGIGPRELLGAMTGEAGVRGDQIGRMDIRDTFSRVEVQASVAEAIIRAMNGISIRGRAVRADYDRGGDRGAPERGDRGAPERGDRGDRGDRGSAPVRKGPPRSGGGRPPSGGSGGRPSGGRPTGGRPSSGGRPTGGRPPRS